MESLRDAFGKAIVNLGKKYQNIVVLTADLASSTKVVDFAKKFPSRFFQVGVAEQNLVGIGAGLAMTGKIPFCCSFANFLTGRAWEQIRICVAANNLPVKLIGSHVGFSHQADGFTAQSTEDVSLMRCLPNLTIVFPADFNQMEKAVEVVYQHPGPIYLRMTREPTPVFTSERQEFKIGQAQVIKKGSDITLIAAGPMVYELMLAAEQLAREGIKTEVINLGTIKPMDEKTIITSVKKTGCLLTVEDHQIQGGLGSAIAEVVVKQHPVPMKMLGLDNCFGKTARNYRQLLGEYGLTSLQIVKAIKNFLARKNGFKKD